MIKFGIHNLKQLLRGKTRTFFRKDLKNVSIDLYESNEVINSDELAEQILLCFSDERGVYKRTYANRFNEFENKIFDILKLPHQTSNLVVHDVGVSDARTSCDFFEKLNSHLGKDLKFFASDYDPNIIIIKSNFIKVVINQSGNILQIIVPPFVFNNYKRDSYRHYPLNHIVRFCVHFFLVPKILKKYQKGLISDIKHIQLFCPRAKNIARTSDNFFLLKHNILEPSPIEEPIHIVRAMNILNISYFSTIQMKTAIRNLFDALSENGILMTGSNQNSNSFVDGAFYEKNSGKFIKLWQSGKGSEVDDLILNFNEENIAIERSNI